MVEVRSHAVGLTVTSATILLSEKYAKPTQEGEPIPLIIFLTELLPSR